MVYEDDDLESQRSYSDSEFDIPREDEIEDEIEEEEELPPHACAYCGIADKRGVSQCVKTKKWFCNGKGNRCSGTHIVQHLVKNGLSSIKLHAENPFAQSSLLCYHCASTNIFLLGYIVNKEGTMVMMLCRDPCRYNHKLDTEQWDIDNWIPLIQERQVVSWLLQEPKDYEKLDPITDKEIHTIEEMWIKNPKIKMREMMTDENAMNRHAIMTPSKFPSKYAYGQIFTPLVEKEAEYAKKQAESQTQPNVDVEFPTPYVAQFQFHKDARLEIGDELKLTLMKNGKKSWEECGIVDRIEQDGMVTMSMYKPFDKSIAAVPKNAFTIRFVWRSTSFDRMIMALKKFSKRKTMSDSLLKLLLGVNILPNQSYHYNTTTFETIEKSELVNKGLNETQTKAVMEAVKNTLTLIQGPPGTGKTVTSTEIICQFARKYPDKKILVCAPSNVAVNQLAEKLIKYPQLDVVRLYAKSKLEKLDDESEIFHFTLTNRVRSVAEEDEEAQKAFNEYDENPSSESAYYAYKKHYGRLAREILKQTNVVCCTCVGAGDSRLNGFKFDRILIDECTQATEPEALIPLVRNPKQIVLVGDHRQLGPVVMNKEAAIYGLKRSIFSRLVNLGYTPSMLREQYRMHPALSAFSSETFYHGNLMNGRRAKPSLSLQFNWPNKKIPMLFYNCARGVEEYSSSGTSYLNRTEAQLVEEVVTYFFSLGAKPGDIGIITPYQGQRSFLSSFLPRFGESKYYTYYNSIELASVDAFQGREKNFIILSCVRSNQVGDIGFLKDPCRLNVALTRAKHGLVIIGNLKLLETKPLWNKLLQHYSKNVCIVNQIAKPGRPQIMYPHPIKPMQHEEHMNTHQTKLNNNFKPGRNLGS